jgi:hypothetical protein
VADNPKTNPYVQEQPVRAAKRGTRIADPFTLTDGDIAFARERRVVTSRLELEVMREAFVAHHAAKGTVSKDWRASWRTWVLNAVKFGGGSGTVRRAVVGANSQHEGPSRAMTGAEWLAEGTAGVAPGPVQEGLPL